jgi:cyanophycin synthetase
VIEVNAAPGLRMHLSPSEGKARPAGEAIIDMLYPPGAPYSIPIVSVTGTNGKTTTSRLLKKILSEQYSNVGLTTTDGIWIGNNKVVSGDTTGPHSSSVVLSDPDVDAAVLEVARGGLLRGGLAYEWSDVSVITNIRPDHLGQDGIESLEDLVWIKSLVAERVKEGGTLVLNADDYASAELRNNPRILKTKKNFFLYSLRADNSLLKEHLSNGGSGCWVENDWIVLQKNEDLYKLVKVTDIPLTLSGTAAFQISNVLAATAAAVGMSVEIKNIIQGLISFNPSEENLGRLNFYKLAKGHVVLDYAHNPDALSAISELTKHWEGKKTVLVGLPGDRADHLLKECAITLAQNFDHVIFRDDRNLRGRAPGEVPRMLANHIKVNVPRASCHIELDEQIAMNSVLPQLNDTDVVVILYDDLDLVMKHLRQFDPIPVANIPLMKTKSNRILKSVPSLPLTSQYLEFGLAP